MGNAHLRCSLCSTPFIPLSDLLARNRRALARSADLDDEPANSMRIDSCYAYRFFVYQNFIWPHAPAIRVDSAAHKQFTTSPSAFIPCTEFAFPRSAKSVCSLIFRASRKKVLLSLMIQRFFGYILALDDNSEILNFQFLKKLFYLF